MKRAIALPLFLLLVGCGLESTEGESNIEDVFAEEQTFAADGADSKWETDTTPDSPTGTHQWLVRQAMRLLAANGDSAAANTPLGLFATPDCEKQMIQGVFDSDWLARYTGASQDVTPAMGMLELLWYDATFAAHFYNPDTGKNWLGQTTPTAKEFALGNVDLARDALKKGDLPLACHELGVALHFVGDITQPMHTALFTAISPPFKLHGNLEIYAEKLHEKYTVSALSAPLPAQQPAKVIDQIAGTSKRLWGETKAAIQAAYKKKRCRVVWFADNPTCWEGDPEVDKLIGTSLIRAQQDLALFLHAINLQ